MIEKLFVFSVQKNIYPLRKQEYDSEGDSTDDKEPKQYIQKHRHQKTERFAGLSVLDVVKT